MPVGNVVLLNDAEQVLPKNTRPLLETLIVVVFAPKPV